MNITAHFNLMAVYPIIGCLSRDLVTEYRHGLEYSAFYTAPPFFVETLPGRSNRSLPHLPLHMPAEAIIPTFLTLNIYIVLCLPNGLKPRRLRSYEIFTVLVIVRINQCVGLRGILHFRLLRDACLYRLARGIPLKEGVPYSLQSMVRTPPPHLR